MEMDSVCMCAVLNIIYFRLGGGNTFLECSLLILGNPTLPSIIGSRLLINLKEAGDLGLNESTNYRLDSTSASEIVFVEGNTEGQQLFLFSMYGITFFKKYFCSFAGLDTSSKSERFTSVEATMEFEGRPF